MSLLGSDQLSYKACPTATNIDRISAGEVAEIDITVTDNNGCLADFTVLGADGEGNPPAPEYDDGELVDPPPPESYIPESWQAEYVAKPAYWTDAHLIRLPLTVIDSSQGKFRLKVTRRDIVPGVYIAEASFYAPGRVLRLRERRWLEAAPTLHCVNHGPITEQEVRLAMRDFACYNTLLQREESSPEEIMFAIRRPIDMWNSLPPIGVAIHTVIDFPYREEWLRAAVGFLLKSHAIHRLRNEMTVSNPTLQIKDNDRFDSYGELGERYVSEYRQWALEAKRAVNMLAGFGSLGSPYGLMGRYYW